MLASRTFDSILDQIQSSNMSFKMQIYPLSANISIKRSPLKDKSGAPILLPNTSSTSSCLPKPSGDLIAALSFKIIKLERSSGSLIGDYESAVQDCVAAHQKIKLLEVHPKVKSEPDEALMKDLSEKNYLVNTLNCKIVQQSKENENYQTKINILNVEIQDLERANKKSNEISNKLNKQISEERAKFKKEKIKIDKEHKAEIKAFRKDLGEENKQKLKLLKSVENTSPQSLLENTPYSKTPVNPPRKHCVAFVLLLLRTMSLNIFLENNLVELVRSVMTELGYLMIKLLYLKTLLKKLNTPFQGKVSLTDLLPFHHQIPPQNAPTLNNASFASPW